LQYETSREVIGDLCQHFLRRPADPDLMNALAKLPVPEILAILAQSTEHRAHLESVYGDLPPDPPARTVFFHIAKTGGTTIAGILHRIYPLFIVSPQLQGVVPADSRWTVVCGHFDRFEDLQMLHDLDERRKITIIREPVSWVTSLYKYWRHDIPPGHIAYDVPSVGRARELPFSEFIRSVEDIENGQSFLAGYAGDKSARDALSYFDLVGVTDQLPVFVARMLSVLGIQQPYTPEQLIAQVPSNASSGSVELTEDDRRYIRSTWARDVELYEAAKEVSR
jgi:hypothetical protein